MIRIGLIGPGKWGQHYLEDRNGAYPIAVLRTKANVDKPIATARPGSVQVFHELDKFLDVVDAAIIATPPSSHADLAIQCMGRGCPVLIEKPLALTMAQVEEIDACSVGTKVPYMVAHVHLYSDMFTPPGDAVRMVGTHGGPERRDYSALLDWGAHAIGMAVRSAGQPSGCAMRQLGDDRYIIRLDFPSGCTADLMLGNFPSRRGPSFIVWNREATSWSYRPHLHSGVSRTPIHSMVLAFIKMVESGKSWNEEEKTVYRVLFSCLEQLETNDRPRQVRPSQAN